MRAFSLVVALVLPLLAAAQCVDDVSALCCATVQDATLDNLDQLGTLRQEVLPQIDGSIGLICGSLDSTCAFLPLCCTNEGFESDGSVALGCTATTLPDA